MKRLLLVLPLTALISFAIRAADTQPSTVPSTAPSASTAAAPQPALLAIRYQRSGGFAGTNDVIEITPEGVVAVQGKLMGTAKGQMTKDQIATLVPLFDDWKNYKQNYPTPTGTADAFVIRIRYGSSEVVASELNTTVPETFNILRKAIEQIAADAKAADTKPATQPK